MKKGRRRFTRPKRSLKNLKDYSAQKNFFGVYLIKSGEKRLKLTIDKQQSVRIVPPTWIEWEEGEEEGYQHYGISLYYHNKVGIKNSDVLCYEYMETYCQQRFNMSFQRFLERNGIDFTVPKGCPICTDIRKHEVEGDESWRLYPNPKNPRILVYVINRQHEELGPIPWAMSYKEFDSKLVFAATSEKGNEYFIEDEEDGRDVQFLTTKQGKYTTYAAINVDTVATPLSPDEDKMAEWLEYAEKRPVIHALNLLTEEQITAMISGSDATDTHEYEKEEEESEDDIPFDSDKEEDMFSGMDRKELRIYIRDNRLPIKVMTKMTDEDIREAIREETYDVEEEEEESEDHKEAQEKVKELRNRKPRR